MTQFPMIWTALIGFTLRSHIIRTERELKALRSLIKEEMEP
jgi:hypothetical protein